MEKYDIAIIGAGPAGMSAAVYASRAGMKTVLIDRNPMGGGQIINTYEVDNYLGLPGINGFDMAMKFHEHAMKMGVEFISERVDDICIQDKGFEVKTEKETINAYAVIWTAGAEHAKLGIKGEEELAGKGVSYCATCDGAFFRGRKTAVIGGGDVAIEDAIYLAAVCSKVYLVHRRDELRGTQILQDQFRQLDNAEILYSHVPDEIIGTDKVQALKLTDLKNGEKKEIDVDGVFIAVGINPNTDIIRKFADCDDRGYVKADESGETSVPGFFVAGDVRKKPLRQIITAVADGANAAVAAADYCRRIKA